MTETSEAKVYDDQFHLDVKRFYAPVRVEGRCPSCRAWAEHDINRDPLDYPRFGRELSVGLTCKTEGCIHSLEAFYVMVQLTLRAEATSEAMTYEQMVARRSAQ